MGDTEPGIEVIGDADEASIPNDPARRRLLKQAGVGLAVAWTAPIILSAHVPAAAATPLCPDCGKDLIKNGSAETGFTDWQGLQGAPEIGQYGASVVSPVVSPADPGGGGSYFFRGSSALDSKRISRFEQRYTFPAACISEFASGTYSLDLSAYLGGEDDVSSGRRSTAEVTLTQRAGTTTLSSTTLGPYTGSLASYTAANIPIETSTTSFRLEVRFTRSGPSGPNNAWADMIAVTLNC